MDSDSIETMNRALRPTMVWALMVVAVIFALGMALVLLWKFATTPGLDWQGLVAFCTLVLFPTLKWMNDRADIKKIEAHRAAPAMGPGAAAGIATA